MRIISFILSLLILLSISIFAQTFQDSVSRSFLKVRNHFLDYSTVEDVRTMEQGKFIRNYDNEFTIPHYSILFYEDDILKFEDQLTNNHKYIFEIQYCFYQDTLAWITYYNAPDSSFPTDKNYKVFQENIHWHFLTQIKLFDKINTILGSKYGPPKETKDDGSELPDKYSYYSHERFSMWYVEEMKCGILLTFSFPSVSVKYVGKKFSEFNSVKNKHEKLRKEEIRKSNEENF